MRTGTEFLGCLSEGEKFPRREILGHASRIYCTIPKWTSSVDQVLDFHKRNPKEIVSTVEPNLRSVLNIFDGFLKEHIVQDGKTILPERLDVLKHNLEPIFVLAIVWGTGGAYDTRPRWRASSMALYGQPWFLESTSYLLLKATTGNKHASFSVPSCGRYCRIICFVCT